MNKADNEEVGSGNIFAGIGCSDIEEAFARVRFFVFPYGRIAPHTGR
ncbi:MAG: hypothetical protein Q8L15_19965 [Methylobacter sp.]|nr:hypothetical protein [Methylobacter sp.]